MRPNSQLSVDLVTFTEEIINEELHFLYSVWRLKTETSGEFFFFHKTIQNGIYVISDSSKFSFDSGANM